MAEAGVAIFIATGVILAIVTAIQFGGRAYRYRRMEEQKPTGTMGLTYDQQPS
jgi:hypothetical protein